MQWGSFKDLLRKVKKKEKEKNRIVFDFGGINIVIFTTYTILLSVTTVIPTLTYLEVYPIKPYALQRLY